MIFQAFARFSMLPEYSSFLIKNYLQFVLKKMWQQDAAMQVIAFIYLFFNCYCQFGVSLSWNHEIYFKALPFGKSLALRTRFWTKQQSKSFFVLLKMFNSLIAYFVKCHFKIELVAVNCAKLQYQFQLCLWFF